MVDPLGEDRAHIVVHGACHSSDRHNRCGERAQGPLGGRGQCCCAVVGMGVLVNGRGCAVLEARLNGPYQAREGGGAAQEASPAALTWARAKSQHSARALVFTPPV